MLEQLGLTGCTVEITLTDDRFMRVQNKKHLGSCTTTDVLSFPQVNVLESQAGRPSRFRNQHLGDILVSLDQAERQAKAQGLPLNKEIAFLVLHSILHLLGHDHDIPKRREKMQRMESRIWKALFSM